MLRRSSLLLSALLLSQACNPVTEEPPAAAPEPVAAAEQKLAVPGFAELHHHMFAEQAFSGGWFHGSHTGTLVSCDGGEPESDHARLRMDISDMLDVCPNSDLLNFNSVPLLKDLFRVGGAVASEAIGMIEGTDGDTGLHLGRKEVTTQWPRWDTIAHQQAWEGWLRKAHQGGLSLVSVSA
jgi:hypothetical protein